MSRKIKVLAPIALALGVSGALFGLGPAGSGEQVANAGVCVSAPFVQVDVDCYSRNFDNGGWHNRDDCWDWCDWDRGNHGRPPSPPGNWNWDGWNWVPPFPPPYSDPWTQWYWDGWNWCRV